MREEAEKAACLLLGRPLDRVIAGSFAFMPAPLGRPDDLEVRWTEVWEAGPQPPDMRSFTVTLPDPVVVECDRMLSRRETFDKAPEIPRWLDYVDAQDRELRAAFRS